MCRWLGDTPLSFSLSTSFPLSAARAPVIADVNLPETVGVLRALGGHSIYGINSKPIVDNLTVLCALSPSVGSLLAELITFHSTNNLQIVHQPQVPKPTPALLWGFYLLRLTSLFAL